MIGKPIGFDTRHQGQWVSVGQRTRLDRQKAREGRDRFWRVKHLIEKLRRCLDVVNRWDDESEKGFRWWQRVFDLLAPPPDMTVNQWADRYRRIPPEFAAEPGDWRTARVPAMRAVMEACSPSHDCRRVILVKPTQSGGTEAAILNTIGHTIDINPRSMLVIFPTIDLAEAFSKERLDPMIKMIPRLSDKVSDGTTLAERSSVKKKKYPGGFLNMAGANSTSGLSSRPVPIVIMDEVDDCIRNAGSAGNPTKLLSARTTTFADKKEIFISSPSNEAEETGIIQMWEDSTQGWLETQCPNQNCLHWQVLDWDQMDLESATLSCTRCGQYFPQWKWNRGEEVERYRFDKPEHASTVGFRMSGLNSPWLDWRIDLCDEYREAKRIEEMGDTSLMRVFVNTKLTKPYRQLGKHLTMDLYHDRREVYPCHAAGAEIPDGVILLTAGVDVQDTYLTYDITGWGRGRESWGIESGEFQGNPHVLINPRFPGRSVWEQIDRFLYNRLFRYSDGQMTKIKMIFVDSGGHCTTEVYKYCKSRHPRVFAIKGQGGVGKAMIIGGKVRERSEGAWLLRLGVDTLKDEFHARMGVVKPGPGYCHWPMLQNGEDTMGYTESYFKQLISERRILTYTKGGFARYEWHKNRSEANEALDMRCYARAALDYLKIRLEQIPRDVRSRDSDLVERVEVGFGKTILVDKTRRQNYDEQKKTPQERKQTTTKMDGLSAEADELSINPTPDTVRNEVSVKYGAVSTSF